MSPELNTYQQALCVRFGVQVPRNPYACPMGGVACLQFQPPKVETGEPQSKLATKSWHICKLWVSLSIWVWLTDPSLISKVEEPTKTIPYIHLCPSHAHARARTHTTHPYTWSPHHHMLTHIYTCTYIIHTDGKRKTSWNANANCIYTEHVQSLFLLVFPEQYKLFM